MPTKRLPPSPDIDHLKNQAKDLLAAFRAGEMSAYQRLREFHPHLNGKSDADLAGQTVALSDVLLSIAREYGYQSWPRLKTVVAESKGQPANLTHNERIENEIFRQALDFLDEGNEAHLQAHLNAHPSLVHQRILFEGDNYFTEPTLLEFIAENPVRQGRLPDNVLDIAEIILNAGAKDNQKALDETLMLTASGSVARESGKQIPLINLLCDRGANPEAAMQSALTHGEFDAAHRLIARGASINLARASALSLGAEATKHLPNATEDEIQLSLALAALHANNTIVKMLLEAGADPNRYNPPGGHSHCTPLHSATFEGHLETVKILVEGGARCDIPDIHHNATAIDWAEFAGHTEIADYLKTNA